MQTKKKQALLLGIQIIIAIIIHIGIPLLKEALLEKRKTDAKIKFNNMLEKGELSNEILNYLKILINNYESLSDTSIINSEDPIRLRKACDSIEPINKKLFLLYSLKMNLAILGTILLPTLSYSVKKVFK